MEETIIKLATLMRSICRETHRLGWGPCDRCDDLLEIITDMEDIISFEETH